MRSEPKGYLRAHFLPRDPLERRPAGSSPQAMLGPVGAPCPPLGATALAGAAAGTPFGRVGGRRETAHNVTPAADYRTAVLSDSP